MSTNERVLAELPQLPEPEKWLCYCNWHEESGYSEDQMREYARAAIAALKAERPAADEVLIAIKRDEGYEDVHPELVAEDFVRNPTPWRYRVLTPAQESANG